MKPNKTVAKCRSGEVEKDGFGHLATGSLGHSRGQALIEFALMGSFALLALAFMIQIGLRMNYQQELEQQTFRQALRVAKSEGDEESASIQIQHFRDRQIPNPSQGFATMSRTPTQAASTTNWGEHFTRLEADDRDSQPRIIINVNGQPAEFRSEDFPSDQPLVSRIQKTVESEGLALQTNAASSARTTTTERTTLILSNNATVSSELASDVSHDWAQEVPRDPAQPQP